MFAFCTSIEDCHPQKNCFKMSTVIICADASTNSKFALDYYLKYVHSEGKLVKVVHCPENWRRVGVMEGPTPATLHRLQEEADANTKSIKEDSERKLAQCGVPGHFQVLDDGEPWHGIVKQAEKDKASLIVVGTRGQGTLKSAILGSVSSAVMHHAHCPVLICRQD